MYVSDRPEVHISSSRHTGTTPDTSLFPDPPKAILDLMANKVGLQKASISLSPA